MAEDAGADASKTCSCPIAEITANCDENAGKKRNKNGSPTTGTGLRARNILTSYTFKNRSETTPPSLSNFNYTKAFHLKLTQNINYLEENPHVTTRLL